MRSPFRFCQNDVSTSVVSIALPPCISRAGADSQRTNGRIMNPSSRKSRCRLRRSLSRRTSPISGACSGTPRFQSTPQAWASCPSGPRTTAAIRRTCPGNKILILTSFPGAPELSAALKAGANGALAKTSTQAELTRAIHAIAIGERIVADEIEAQRRFEQSLPPLTPAQLEVLSLLSKGLSNQDIGRILNISPNSVKDRLKLTFARLGVANRTEAVAFALRQNLLG